MKKLILKLINKFGYLITKVDTQSIHYKTMQEKGLSNPEIKKELSEMGDIKEPEFWEIYKFCGMYGMTSIERMYGLYLAVDYILSNNIQGAFVECGVWRGANCMIIAKMLQNRNINDRKIYLYDTFEGMSEPTDDDYLYTGYKASVLLASTKTKKEGIWCYATLEEVKKNLLLTNYPKENLIYVKGKVEDTLPKTVPDEDIALLRLDTDWYESTKQELIYLFPKVTFNGVLIIDDYGCWEGCRKAVDEYFRENKLPVLLNRLDSTGRIVVKTSLNTLH